MVNREFLVQLHITERCSLSCAHCYQGDAKRAEMPLSRIRQVLEQISDTFRVWKEEHGLEMGLRLQLTGGEPLLRRDLFDIVATGRSLGMLVTLLTSGIPVNPEVTGRIASSGIAFVQISLEGDRWTHDAVRGKGTYDRAASAAESLADRGIFVSINTTLSRLNADQSFKLVCAARDMGASRISFSRLVPSGRGVGLLATLLSPKELRDVFSELRAIENPVVEVVCRDPLTALFEEPPAGMPGDLPVGGCAAGVSGITILPDGTASACRRLGLELGNLLEMPFRQVWVDSPKLDALRDRAGYSDACRECERWPVCRGCRAIARALYAGDGPDFLSDDPQCWK